jgi:hypothetical protein
MEIIIIIFFIYFFLVVIIAAIKYWKIVLSGLIWGLILGFIGGLVDDDGGFAIASAVGFLLGSWGMFEEEKLRELERYKVRAKQEGVRVKTKQEWAKTHAEQEEARLQRAKEWAKAQAKQGSAREHERDRGSQTIVSCPSCGQKIRVRKPLRANRAICKTCSSRFNIYFDLGGQARVELIEEDANPQEKWLDVLDLPIDAGSLEIKSAYKRKMREYHPDKVAALGSRLKEVAEEESKRINMAYRNLKECGRV